MKKKKLQYKEMIFYPQFCFDCQLAFISKKKNVVCRICKNKNVINCFKEIAKNEI